MWGRAAKSQRNATYSPKKPCIHKRALNIRKTPIYLRTLYFGQGGAVTQSGAYTRHICQKSPIKKSIFCKRDLYIYAPVFLVKAVQSRTAVHTKYLSSAPYSYERALYEWTRTTCMLSVYVGQGGTVTQSDITHDIFVKLALYIR